MKKFLFILFGLFAVAGAFAAGENVPTSKSYVDAAVAQKQDKVSANIIMPAGYTRLEYLESTGTQWIDTGVVFNSDIGYELEYQPKTTNNWVVQAGARGQVIAQGGNIWEFRFNGSINRRPSPSEIDLTQFVNIKYNIDNKCSVDNRIVYIGDLTLNASGSIRLFGPNVASDSNVASSGRMSFFLIYDNGVLVNNLVPARRDSDNVVGMYDTISGQFFTNSGTGEFIAGPVIMPGNQVLTNTGTAGEYGTKGIYDANGEYATQTQNLVDAATMNTAVQNAIDSEFQCIEWDEHGECLLLNIGSAAMFSSGYTALEYIESTGTQWIDTGVIPTVNTKARVKFLTTGQCGGFGLFGARKDPYRFNATTFNGGSQIGFGMTNNSWPVNRMPCQLNSIYDCTMSNGYVKVNDTEYLETPVSESEWSPDVGTFKLASLQGAGTVVPDEYASRGVRWYVVQLWENNVLIRDFIPARHNSDNKIGMYDTVTNTFFTNSGTGEFIAGPVGGAVVYLPQGN